MKIILRTVSLVMAIIMLFSFSSCEGVEDVVGSNEDYVMKYGDFSLNEKEYMYIASYVKDQVVYNQQSYLYQYTGTVYDESDILAMPVDDETTFADLITERTIKFAQQILIIENLCDEAKLVIDDQEDLDEIEGYIADVEYAYGGEDLFEIALARMGFSRSGIERLRKATVLYEKLYDHRYGEGGIARIPSDTVNKYFVDNYYSYDAAVFSYIDQTTGEKLVFDYTDDEIEEYFYSDYVKVRHILYKTVDSSGKELEESKLKEKEDKAKSAYDSIVSGEKSFDDFVKDTEDSGTDYVFTYGQMVKEFEDASFEMNVGDVRLVKSEFGYHIIEKLEMSDTDLYGVKKDDGKTTGDITKAVAAKMSSATIRKDALDVLDKLNNGDIKEYPEADKEKEYYSLIETTFIDKNNTSYKSLIDVLKELEVGVYTEKEFSNEGTYIFRLKDFTSEDITSDIYSKIEESLSFDAYSEYTESHYDSVEVNETLLEKFDVTTLPALEEEFYTE